MLERVSEKEHTRQSERERVCVCVCVRERAREYVCEREKGRERERKRELLIKLAPSFDRFYTLCFYYLIFSYRRVLLIFLSGSWISSFDVILRLMNMNLVLQLNAVGIHR